MNDVQQEIIQQAIHRHQQSRAQTNLLAAHVNELLAIAAAGEPEPQEDEEQGEDDS